MLPAATRQRSVSEPKYDTPQKTIDDFDFTIVSVAYDGKEFIAHERFYLDVAQRRIVITNLVKPLNTLKCESGLRDVSGCAVAPREGD